MKLCNWRLFEPGVLVRAKLSVKERISQRMPHLVCVLLLGLAIGLPVHTFGQDIEFRNPSLEGIPAIGKVPPSWNECGKTPDTQPQKVVYCGITLPASDGKTYVGLLCTSYLEEGLSQKLNTPLKAGVTYTISFDMAYPSYYCINTCYGQMAMYAGDSARDKGELLWVSPEFTNAGWQRFTATFTPKSDHPYLSCWAHVERVCTNSTASAVLIDNFSPALRVIPKISVSARNACKGMKNGQASVSVKEGIGPFTYKWFPNGATTSRTDHLDRGKYTVQVTAENGTAISADVTIDEVSVGATASVSSPSCFGSTDAQISVTPMGGTAPYAYSFDGGDSYTTKEELDHVGAGDYALKVKDAFGCSVDLQRVHIDQPDALSVLTLHPQPTSCIDNNDGKISLAMQGGTAPYQYKVSGVSWQYDSVFQNLRAGSYQYDVRDGHDCIVQGNTDVEKDPNVCSVKVPTAFSPNGDGLNDQFRVWLHDNVSHYQFTVYNRWGKLVFATNDPAMCWDGKQQGTPADQGGYLWVLLYTDSHQQARKQTGSVVLVR